MTDLKYYSEGEIKFLEKLHGRGYMPSDYLPWFYSEWDLKDQLHILPGSRELRERNMDRQGINEIQQERILADKSFMDDDDIEEENQWRRAYDERVKDRIREINEMSMPLKQYNARVKQDEYARKLELEDELPRYLKERNRDEREEALEDRTVSVEDYSNKFEKFKDMLSPADDFEFDI